MYLIKLILKNSLRHRLRTLLTIVGLIVATVAFGLPPDARDPDRAQRRPARRQKRIKGHRGGVKFVCHRARSSRTPERPRGGSSSILPNRERKLSSSGGSFSVSPIRRHVSV